MTNNNVIVGKPIFYALIVMNAIALTGIFLSFYSGQEDRAIIKVRISQILGSLNETIEELHQAEENRELRSNRSSLVQNVTLAEIVSLERGSEERAQRLLPGFEQLLNDFSSIADSLNNITVQQKQMTVSLVNITDEQDQLTANQREIINLLNATG